ncbi:MAG: HEPN domain-containing protein [Truepera sp.]|nr:HEPN domain-containing protein [Truepera sp.]
MTGRAALWQKADRYLRSATLLAADGDLDSAASRLYYAMFYSAEALLDAEGMSFSSHQALISAYGQRFARTGELDPRFHRALITAFNRRQLGDYLAPSGLTADDIDDMRADAEAFLAATKRYLKVP